MASAHSAVVHRSGLSPWTAQRFPQQQSRSSASSGSRGSGAEEYVGAPLEGYKICAEGLSQTCKCKHGEVRYGLGYGSLSRWTLPVKLGSADSVSCTLPALDEFRVSMPSGGGAQENQFCECIARTVTIKTNVGTSATSLAEKLEATSNLTEWLDVPQSGIAKAFSLQNHGELSKSQITIYFMFLKRIFATCGEGS